MRILHFLLVSLLLKNVYCDSTNIQLDEDRRRLPAPRRPPPPPPRAPPPPPPQAPPPPQVTSYILAAQWPPGVCTGKDVTCQINPMPTEFTIHGLSPQPNGAPSTETFAANKISTLSSELNKNWPNLKSAQQSENVNLAFWQEEWNTNGKYSGLGVTEYFQKSLQLFKNDVQGLKTKFVAQKITPSVFQTYKLKDIQTAVKKINGGFSGTIICVQRQGGSKKQQIQEIQFSYTKDFKKKNNGNPSNCGPEIMFPVPLYVTSYILAVSWPPGVCTGESGVACEIKQDDAFRFTIHGLWPQPDDQPTAEEFDSQKISTLSDKLSKYWPNLKSKQQSISINIVFWRNEWMKHGKFSGLGLREYYEKSLELLNDGGQELKKKLGDEKIKPNNYDTYKLADIQAAVEKINGGFSAYIICVKRKNSAKKQIQEIRFKYTNDFQKQNYIASSNCDTDILFPSFDNGLTEVVSMPEIHHQPL